MWDCLILPFNLVAKPSNEECWSLSGEWQGALGRQALQSSKEECVTDSFEKAAGKEADGKGLEKEVWPQHRLTNGNAFGRCETSLQISSLLPSHRIPSSSSAWCICLSSFLLDRKVTFWSFGGKQKILPPNYHSVHQEENMKAYLHTIVTFLGDSGIKIWPKKVAPCDWLEAEAEDGLREIQGCLEGSKIGGEWRGQRWPGNGKSSLKYPFSKHHLWVTSSATSRVVKTPSDSWCENPTSLNSMISNSNRGHKPCRTTVDVVPALWGFNLKND